MIMRKRMKTSLIVKLVSHDRLQDKIQDLMNGKKKDKKINFEKFPGHRTLFGSR